MKKLEKAFFTILTILAFICIVCMTFDAVETEKKHSEKVVCVEGKRYVVVNAYNPIKGLQYELKGTDGNTFWSPANAVD